jgi:hypothetical protein
VENEILNEIKKLSSAIERQADATERAVASIAILLDVLAGEEEEEQRQAPRSLSDT